MKLNFLIILALIFAEVSLMGQSKVYIENSPKPPIVRVPTFTDGEIVQRLRNMHSDVVAPRFDNIVRSYIQTYTVKNRPKTEAMLGRTAMYFPLFEKYLREANLPNDLKYLSVVESALDPTAVSRSGAVGLWQFMPGTGKDYGLRVSYFEDQRRDPHRSTEAAFKYLKRLYQRFGSWELALAAYNGGPGRVNRAIRRGRSKNFWTIRKYLPRETRNYVPAFIAATYIMHYYEKHNLFPLYPEKQLQITDRTMVYRKISFQEIADITDTPMEVITRLNPSYLRRVVPAKMNGCSVVLPIAALAIFENFLGKPDRRSNGMISSAIPAPTSPQHRSDYFKTTYKVQSGDHLEKLAEMFECTPKDIIEWNRLTSARLHPQQRLVFYLPRKASPELMKPVPSIPRQQMRLLNESPVEHQLKPVEPISFTPRNRQFLRPGKKEKFIYHQVRRRETLAEIASKYPGVSPQDILRINKFHDGQYLKPGKKIKIKTR